MSRFRLPDENGDWKKVVTLNNNDKVPDEDLPDNILRYGTEELDDPMPINADQLGGHPANYFAPASSLNNYIPSTDKGAENGVASLGPDGKVPDEQLPEISSGLASDVSYFVDKANGDDTNEGTTDNPFKTIGKALSMVPKALNGYTASIYIKIAGVSVVMSEDIDLRGYANGTLRIWKNTEDSDKSFTVGGYVNVMNCDCTVKLGMDVINPSTTPPADVYGALNVKNCKYLYLDSLHLINFVSGYYWNMYMQYVDGFEMNSDIDELVLTGLAMFGPTFDHVNFINSYNKINSQYPNNGIITLKYCTGYLRLKQGSIQQSLNIEYCNLMFAADTEASYLSARYSTLYFNKVTFNGTSTSYIDHSNIYFISVYAATFAGDIDASNSMIFSDHGCTFARLVLDRCYFATGYSPTITGTNTGVTAKGCVLYFGTKPTFSNATVCFNIQDGTILRCGNSMTKPSGATEMICTLGSRYYTGNQTSNGNY